MSQNISPAAALSLSWDQVNLNNLSRPALVLAILYVILPLIIYFAPNTLSYWLFATVLALPPQKWWSQILGRLSLGLATRAIILLIVWIAISLIWTPIGAAVKATNLLLVSVFGVGFVFSVLGLSENDRLLVRNTTLVGFSLAILLMLVDVVSNFALSRAIYGNDWSPIVDQAARSVAALVALSWPLIGVLAIGRSHLSAAQGTLVAGLTLAAFAYASLELQGLISLLAFGLGGITLLLVHWRPRFGISLIGAAFVGYLILAPTIHMLPLTVLVSELPMQTPLAWEYRLGIWHSTALQIFENPALGLGFDGSSSLNEVMLVMRGLERPAIPGHPHNLFLQVWLELGLVGVALIASLLVGLLGFIWSKVRSPLQAGLFAAALVTYLIEAILNFGAWEIWWIATAWITLGTCFFAPRRA